MAHVVLIGQAFVDVFTEPRSLNVRLGGIFHAARALWALQIPYSVCYLAPSYLDDEIEIWSREHDVVRLTKIGDILGSPNVVLIGDHREVGAQGYEMILERHKCVQIKPDKLKNHFGDLGATDVLVFPGGFSITDLLPVLKDVNVDVHIDAISERSSNFSCLGKKLTTFIISTSSDAFFEEFNADVKNLTAIGKRVAEDILLKENRGGSRFFSNGSSEIKIPAQTTEVFHSVGVGDCYNAVYVGLRKEIGVHEALTYAAFVATEYAVNVNDEQFRISATRAMSIPSAELMCLGGVSLPWEQRKEINIYVAAPDFEKVDRSHIRAIVNSLTYHNFSPRLPVQEHGEIDLSADMKTKRDVADRDIRLLEQCDLLIAVLEYNDPGTFIEIGIAYARSLPVLVYDPHGIASNLMITSTAQIVSGNKDKLISELFKIACEISTRKKPC